MSSCETTANVLFVFLEVDVDECDGVIVKEGVPDDEDVKVGVTVGVRVADGVTLEVNEAPNDIVAVGVPDCVGVCELDGVSVIIADADEESRAV